MLAWSLHHSRLPLPIGFCECGVTVATELACLVLESFPFASPLIFFSI